MSRPVRRYARAPIAEAVIEIRTQLADDVDLDQIAAVYEREAERYPKKGSRFESQVVFSPSQQPSTTHTVTGYQYHSADGKQVFQARLDGFAHSRLAPYEGWESFRDEARRLWDVYRDIAAPVSATRVAVRYINRLDLPLPVADFEDYLCTVPKLSPGLPQGLTGYFMQLQIPQEDLDAMLILNEGIVPPPAPDLASVVLDIDLHRDVSLPPGDEKVWAFLDDFRWRKNEVFEACITDAMRRMID
jgi:uncharacterized protein (TIGR04255 family)